MNEQPRLHAEQPIVFPCGSERLVGILSRPLPINTSPSPAEIHQDLAVLVVVGGPQYRAGAHRMFVDLCRTLARAGFPSLRFDARGMGDSTGEFPGFEQLQPDIDSAVIALQSHLPHIRRVVLWGLCDGASACLLARLAGQSPHIEGLMLVNPWVRSTATLARTHLKHHYLDRLMQPEFWRKLARGELGFKALSDLGKTMRESVRLEQTSANGPAPFPSRMAQQLAGYPGWVQIVLSGDDFTAQEFEDHCARDVAWRTALSAARVQWAKLPSANHTMTHPADKAELFRLTEAFLHQLSPTSTAGQSLPLPDRVPS